MNTLTHPRFNHTQVILRFVTLFLITACLTIFLWTDSYAAAPQQAMQSHSESALTPRLYVPLIENPTTRQFDAEHQGEGEHNFEAERQSEAESCMLDAEAAELMDLIRTHPDQQRATLHCDPILSRVAAEKAQDMASRGYFDHVSPNGIGPNYLVRSANFPLSERYSSDMTANNIETISAGTMTPAKTLKMFLKSSGHRVHLLGENDFYRAQEHIGIGTVEDPSSPYRYYWVVLIAEAEVKN